MTKRIYTLAEGHPLLRDHCPFCENQFRAGDVITLSPLPPDDPIERAKMDAGAVYTTAAVPMILVCVFDGE